MYIGTLVYSTEFMFANEKVFQNHGKNYQMKEE